MARTASQGPADAGLGRHLGRDRALLTTSSNISAAPRARPATSRARCSAGGNPFEGARSREYPTPPLKMPYSLDPVRGGGEGAGLASLSRCRPANLSEAYVNPLGIAMGQCTYCGYCERFGCANYSKASAQTTILPVLMKKPNFEAAHRMRSAEGQSAPRRQDGQKRHLYRRRRRGIRTARRHRHPAAAMA